MLFPQDSGDLEGSLLAFGSLRACTMVWEGFPFYSSGIRGAVNSNKCILKLTESTLVLACNLVPFTRYLHRSYCILGCVLDSGDVGMRKMPSKGLGA